MVIKKKSDNNWEYCIYLGLNTTGKKKYKRKCGFKTRKACIEESSTFKNNKISTKNNLKTLEDIYSLFIQDCTNRGLKPTTIITYNTQIKFLLKNFKHHNKDIKKIKINDIHNFINTKLTLYHGTFKRKIIEFLKYIFSYAEKNKFINNNIFNDIKLPPLSKPTINIWNQVEINRYLPILKKFKYFDIILLTLETGVRRGEVMGLTWDCVDLNKGIITVNKSYTIHTGFIGMTSPKTNSGIRQIVLLDESLKILKKLYENKVSKYVFPNRRNTNIPLNPIYISSCFRKFLKSNNLKLIRFHDLKHPYVKL